MGYFLDPSAIHMVSMSEQEYRKLSEMVYSGGHFARVICKIQRAIYHKTLQKTIDDNEASLKRAVAFTAELAKVKAVDKSQHLSCGIVMVSL